MLRTKSGSLFVVSMLLVAVALGGWSRAAFALDGTWGTSAGNWSDSTKWVFNNVADGIGATGNFTSDISGNITVTIDTTSRTLGTLQIGDSLTGFFSYTIAASGGASLIVDNGGTGGLINHTATGVTDTISAPITLTDDVTVASSTASTFTLSGAITGGGSLTKTGSGVLSLGVALANTGGVNVYNGTLLTGNNTSPFGTAAISIGDPAASNSNSATLNFGNVNGTTSTANLTVNAGSSGTLTLTSPNTMTHSGTTALNNNLTVIENSTVAGKNFTISNTITEGGTAPLTITANNGGSSTAGVSVTGGIVLASGGLTLSNISTGGIFNSSGGVSGTGNLALNISGTGSIALSGAGISYTGTLTNSGSGSGTATVSGALGTNILGVTQNGTSPLILSGVNTFTGGVNLISGTLRLGSTTALGATASGLTILGGTTLDASAAVTIANSNPVTVNGDFTFTGTNSLNMGASPVSLGTVAGTSRAINVNANTLTFGGIISNGTTANSIVKSGNGTLALSGVNTFTGGITIKAGTVSASTTTASLGAGNPPIFLGDTSGTANAALLLTSNLAYSNPLTVVGGSSANTLSVALNNNINYSGPISMNNNLLLIFQANGGETYSGAISGTGNLSIRHTNTSAGNSGNVTSNINMAGSITSVGTSTNDTNISTAIGANVTSVTQNPTTAGSRLLLPSGSAYSGPTTILLGTLNAPNVTNGGANSGLGASSNAASNFVINGGTFQYTQAAIGSTDRLFTLGTGATAATIDSSPAPATNYLAFTNSGALAYSGSGARTLTLTGTNAGGNLQAPAIGDSGGATSVVKNGSGTWILSGANTYSGGTTVNTGLLYATNPSALGTNSNLTIASNAAFAYQPSVTGLLNLGSGTLTLGNGTTLGTAIGGVLSLCAISSTSSAVATGNPAVTVNVYGLPGVAFTNGTHNLVSVPGGLTSGGATYTLGKVFNATNFTLSGFTANDSTISVVATNTVPLGTAFWKGGLSGTATDAWAQSNGTTLSNWSDSGGALTTPLVPGTSTTVSLSASGATNEGAMTLGANMSIAGLSMGTGATARFLNADGNTLTLGTGGITMVSGSPAATLNAPIIMNGAQSWTNSGGVLTVAGSVNNGGALLTIAGTASTTISGLISGSGGLTKTGATTGTVSGTLNTYSGVTTISGAGNILSITSLANGGSPSSIGASSNAASNLLITSGAQLTITGPGTSTDRLFSLGGGPTETIRYTGAGTESFTNTGAIGFSDASSTNTLTFSLSGGPLFFAPLLTDNTGKTSVSMITAGSTTTLANTNSSFTGTVSSTTNAVTLIVSKLANGGSNSSIGASASTASNLVLGVGSTLRYTGTGDSTDRNYTLSGGTTAFTIDSSGTGALAMTGAATYTGSTGSGTFTFTGTCPSNLVNSYGGFIANGSSGNLNLTKSGASTWALGNVASTYTGITAIRAGILSVGTLADGGVNSGIGKSSNLPTNLLIGGGGTLQYTGGTQNTDRLFTVDAQGATIDASGAGNAALVFTNTGTHSPDASSRSGTTATNVLTVGTTADLFVGMVVAGNGIAAGTTISAITSGTTATLSTSPGTQASNTISFGYGPRTLTLAGSSTGANAINGNLTDSATVPTGGTAGTLGVVKSGPGTWVLGGNNSYSGATVVNAGTLRGTGALTSAFTVNANLFPGTAPFVVDPNAYSDFGADQVLNAASITFGSASRLQVVLSTDNGTTPVAHVTKVASQGGTTINSGASLTIGIMSGTYPSNTDIVILSSTGTITGTFNLLTALPAGLHLVYNTNSIVLHSDGGPVSPVKIGSFTTSLEGAAVAVNWTAVSEYQNAGFNVYRRAIQETGEWVRANPALISGRITNPDERKYSFCDWAPAGVYEYKLESVGINGEREFFLPINSAVTVDWNSRLVSPSGISRQTVEAAARSSALESSVESAGRIYAAFSAQSNNGKSLAIGIAPTNASNELETVSNRSFGASTTGTGFEQNPALRNMAAQPAADIRWFSSKSISAVASTLAAKVLYTKPGVMLISQASLPAGFDINHVTLQREGRNLKALALTPSSLLVYAPGYQDDYTDKDAIFLRATRAATAAGSVAAATGLFSLGNVNVTTPATASVEYHDIYFDYSTNLRPYTFAPWYSDKYLSQGTAQDFTLATPLAASGAATLTVNVWSLTSSGTVSPDHKLQVAINGIPVGETTWDGGGRMIQLSFGVPQGILKNGDNIVSLSTPVIAGQDTQIAFVHSMSMGYTRLLDGAKPFEILNNGSTARLYEVYNLPRADTWVVDARYTDRAALVPTQTVQDANGTYRLRFLAVAGGRFLVVPAGQENAPLNVSVRQVKPVRLNGTYLATGPAQFAAGVQPLLSARSKEGVRSTYADQEQLFDYYNYGRYGPDAIRNAVRSVRPQYLLLLGRTTYDYLNYGGLNVDPLCPAYLVSTSFWAQTTSDSMFGDLGRGYPEVAVGRLPVNNATELSGAVGHILNYKGVQTSGIRVHSAADRADPLAGDFPAQSAGIAQTLPDLAWQANYLGVTSQSSPEVSAAMTAAANGGADWLVYVGHGNAVALGNESPRILDLTSVQNWTGNSVFLQATCTANWMAKDAQDYKSIAIQALTQPKGGISASIASSTYMNSSAAAGFMTQLLKNAQANSATRWGSALMRAQQWAMRQNNGNAFYADLGHTEQLFGDPAMPVFSANPNVGARKESTPPGKF